MTEHQHPITPPPELVKQWIKDGPPLDQPKFVAHFIATHAARWGADVELQACEKWLSARTGFMDSHDLHNARRPKPPSLAEDASKALDRLPGPGADSSYLRNWADKEAYGLRCAVRRVLERLQELEQGNE